MGAVLTVKGTIEHGRLAEFTANVGEFIGYRHSRGMAAPQVLQGLSGPVNTVLMLFRYDNLAALDQEASAERRDEQYGRIASKMPYAPGSIDYEIYQEDDHADGRS